MFSNSCSLFNDIGFQLYRKQYRDISPENIFLDANRNAVLADFGMCLKMPFEVFRVDEDQHGVIVETSYGFDDLQSAQNMVRNPQNSGLDLQHRRCLITPQGQGGKFP
jgi:serine/threonine protein kinase